MARTDAPWNMCLSSWQHHNLCVEINVQHQVVLDDNVGICMLF